MKNQNNTGEQTVFGFQITKRLNHFPAINQDQYEGSHSKNQFDVNKVDIEYPERKNR